MHSLVSKDGKYVGKYLRIKNTKQSIRMFAKIYNLAVQDDRFYLTYNNAKDLLLMNMYNLDNNIYANDVNTDEIIFRPVNFGNYIVYIDSTTKLYILTKSEFKKFIKDNKYRKETSTNFILAIDNGDEMFKNFRIITTDSLESAKNIFRTRYNTEPVFIGIEEDNYIYIKTEKDTLVLKIEKGKEALFRV